MRENPTARSGVPTLLLVWLLLAPACKTDDPCPQGQTACNGSCVNTASDPDHCGGCGTACGEAQVCSLGRCDDSCAGGLTLCGRQCVDVATDAMNCGGCSQRCTAGTTCQEGRCTGTMPACQDRLVIEMGGTLDVDLQVVEVSGTLTKNGAAVPSGRGRGTLAFVSRRGGQAFMASFPDSGPATYRGEVMAGTYDIYYQPSPSCPEGGPLPCQRALLRSGVAIQQGGTLDLDAKVVRVSGVLTKNGAILPSTGNDRGRVAFALQGGGVRRMPSFGPTGEARYEGEVFAGTYEVRYEPPMGCGAGFAEALPCQEVVLRSGVAIQQGGTLDLDAKVVRVSGRVTKNGAAVPGGGRDRGRLVFNLEGGGMRRMPSFGVTGEARYEGELFTGKYDIVYQPDLTCQPGEPLPCQNHLIKGCLPTG